jgi:glucose/mannose-6-phosphate isomerase
MKNDDTGKSPNVIADDHSRNHDHNQTTILDSRTEIAKLDQSNMMGSIESLGDQVRHAWEDIGKIEFKPTSDIHNLVMVGMGGSGLGADVIKHLFKDELKVPLDIVNDYTLPAYVNENTLVVLASYSGTTEEVLVCAQLAQSANAQIMMVCAGGDLEKIAQDNGYTMYKIDPKYNPSSQPRMAIGYAVFGAIGLLAKTRLLTLSDQQVQDVIKTINNQVESCKVEIPSVENPAKALAFTMIDRRPIFIVSDFLEGAGHTSTNQHNENAKIFADYKVVPELNHHLLEGLMYPSSNADTHIFIFMQSLLYHQKNIIRMKLTQKIVEDNNIDTITIPLQARTKIEQVFEMLTMLGFAGFYLGMLEGIDPSPIPFVESFKVQLKEAAKDL